MPFEYQTVNVFSTNPLLGNPLAVVKCDKEPSEQEMLTFTKWANLSETTFLMPPRSPGSDYYVRIWTVTGELPFAGHPTLGTAHAWLEGRDQAEIVQECEIGKVLVRKRGNTLAFKAPPCKISPMSEAVRDEILAALGLDCGVLDAQILRNGPEFHVLSLESATLVGAAVANWSKFPIKDMKIGLCGPHPDGSLEVRMLDAGHKVEDPICGSLNAGIAVWMLGNGTKKGSYTVHQGANVERDGLVIIEQEANDIWVGGHVQTVIEGTATF